MASSGNKVLPVFFLLWAVVSCTPILSNPLYYVALLAFAVVMLFVHYPLLRKQQRLGLGVMSYVALVFIYKLVGYSSAAWGNYMNQLLFFIPMLLMVLVPNLLSDGQKRKLWWLVVIVMAFNIVDNIRLCILYPQLNTVNRLYQDEDFLASINAGGTPFYTFSLFFFNACFFVFLNCKEKATKYMALGVAVISAVYILGYCLKGSVVVYFLLSLVLQFFAYKTQNTTLFVVVLALSAMLAFVVLNLFKDAIVDFIISVSPNERLTTRLVTLVDAENEEANMVTITGRTNLYLLSVETWLSDIVNFVIGIGDHRALFGAKATGIGQHADLLDSLARYGLLGLIVLFSIFKNGFKYLLSLFDKKYKLQLIAIFFIIIVFGFTRGLFVPGAGSVLFVLLPLSNVFLKENQQ